MSTMTSSKNEASAELHYFTQKRKALSDAMSLEWSAFKDAYLPHAAAMHWQPPINRRLSTNPIKDNAKVKEVILHYVLY